MEMDQEEIEAALREAEQALAPVLELARARMTASEEQLERMRPGALGQHHADELVRLLCLAAATWLGTKAADGMAGMNDRKEAVHTLKNVNFLLPLLDHDSRTNPKLGE